MSNANPIQATPQISHWTGVRRRDILCGAGADTHSPDALHYAYSMSIAGAIDVAGTVQTICIAVNGVFVQCCGQISPEWSSLCHAYGVFLFSVCIFPPLPRWARLFVLRDFRRNRIPSPEVAASGRHAGEVKWNGVPNCRICKRCHETRRWTPEKQPQPLA